MAKTTKKASVKKVAKKAFVKKKTVVKKSSTKIVVVKKVAAKKAAVKKSPSKKLTVKRNEQKTKLANPLLDSIIDGLEEMKAKNITVLDLNGIKNRSFDYFVIADAESTTHVDSIASSVEE
ncbi:MAG: RsfS/YbeB/iojap family protein, partial [Bacteroidia bacterium]